MLQETFSFRPVDCGAGAVGTNRRLPEDIHNIPVHILAGYNTIHQNVLSVADIRRRHFANALGYAVHLLQLPVRAGRVFFFPFSRGGPRTSAHTYAATLILISILVFRLRETPLAKYSDAGCGRNNRTKTQSGELQSVRDLSSRPGRMRCQDCDSARSPPLEIAK
jgi:hypothetical protein